MAQQISVVSAEMLAAQVQVQMARVDVLSTSSTLNGEVNGLAPGWAGQGGTAFRALMDEWAARLQVVTNALDNFEAALRGTDTVTTEADETQVSTFSPSRLDA